MQVFPTQPRDLAKLHDPQPEEDMAHWKGAQGIYFLDRYIISREFLHNGYMMATRISANLFFPPNIFLFLIRNFM